MDFLRLKAGLLITLPTVAVYKASSFPLVLLCSWSDSILSTHLPWTCLICPGCDQSSTLGGVIPRSLQSTDPCRSGAKTNEKKKKNPAEIIMAERCWNKGSRGYENPPSQTCILAIWIRRRKGPTGISIVSLRPWYQVEDGACTSSFYLVWDWWLDWRAGREETRVLSLQHREEKAMFHKTTHSLLKINLHYTNAICIIRL